MLTTPKNRSDPPSLKYASACRTPGEWVPNKIFKIEAGLLEFWNASLNLKMKAGFLISVKHSIISLKKNENQKA